MVKRLCLCLVLLGACSALCGAAPGRDLDRLVDKAIRVSAKAVERTVGEVNDTLRYPTYATRDELKWRTSSAKNWVSGFWPGCLWYAYALSGDDRFRGWAQSWTAGIGELKNYPDHDLGFRFMCSFGNGVRFAPEVCEGAYTPLILTAAGTLAQLYHPDGMANWDFQSEIACVDASASAVACSAVYELAGSLPQGRERNYYFSQADRMLAKLCRFDYFCGNRSGCLLKHSVRYYHKKDTPGENPNIDEPCVFADYYFLEAMWRYKDR